MERYRCIYKYFYRSPKMYFGIQIDIQKFEKLKKCDAFTFSLSFSRLHFKTYTNISCLINLFIHYK